MERKIEEQIEVTERPGRRRKRLLDNLQETRRYLKLKSEALGSSPWRTHFGKSLWTCYKRDYITNEQLFFLPYSYIAFFFIVVSFMLYFQLLF